MSTKHKTSTGPAPVATNTTTDGETEVTAPAPESPSVALLRWAFEKWRAELMTPLFYFMTRTFAHHRLGEKYDTGLVFEQLEQLNRGNHEAFKAEIDAFEITLIAEYESYLAEKAKRS